MQRSSWKFTKTAEEIRDAALLKIVYHEERLKFWAAKKVETLKRIASEGIEVQESLGGLNYTSNRGYGPQINVRADLQRDLNESHGKVAEHRDKIAEYRTYAEALALDLGARLGLDVDDLQYFFGKAVSADENGRSTQDGDGNDLP